MPRKLQTEKEIVRVDGRLREIITVHDLKGKILHRFTRPLMLEFKARDVIQLIVGATILAIPVGFTEEVWNLGIKLPMANILFLLFLSLSFISIFVYYNYYRNKLKNHEWEFIKRVTSTYVFSFLVVAVILSAIQSISWTTDWSLAFKRTVIVSFPASLSAAVVDIIK